MSRKQRIQFAGAFHHIFNRGAEKRPIFHEKEDYLWFLRLLTEAIAMFEFRLFAYCLMTNHFHLFIQTKENNLSKAMRNLLGRYSQYINWKYKRSGTLFQGRYKNPLVEDDTYAQTLIRYLHLNPVKAAIVKKPEDYTWSSYATHIGKAPKEKWLDTQWVLLQFHKEPFKAQKSFEAFHCRDANPQEAQALRAITHSVQ